MKEGGCVLTKRSDMVGPLNPRWARDGRVFVGQQFGSWVVLSTELLPKSGGALYVRARCVCGVERDVNVRMMEVGRSTQCKGCATRQRHARDGHLDVSSEVIGRLQKRVGDWFQRCRNPKVKAYRNYGARGIECKFSSVKEGVDYVLKHLPHSTYKGLDIDREDNDGHYEPGNLRLVTRSENLLNRSRKLSTTSSTVVPGLGSRPTD